MSQKKRRSAGSKTEISPGKWRLMVSAGHDPLTGKRRRISKVVEGTDREAELMLSAMLAKTGRTVSTSALTLWSYVDQMYLPAMEPPVLRRRTVDGYREKLERHVMPYPVARIRMDRLDSYAMVSWMRGLAEAVPNKQTRLHAYRALSAALGRAVEWGILEANVLTRAVKAPVPDEYEPVILTEDQANDYLDSFTGHVLEPLVVLAIAGGFRPSELYGLEWPDVDFENGLVTVSRGLHERSGRVWTEDTKSRASRRVVTLPRWAIEALRPHRGVGPIRGQLKPTQVAYRYKRHVVDAELPWCPIQNLRHTSATIAMEGGADAGDVAPRFGHTSRTMLDRRYAKRRVARDQGVADVIERFRRTS